LRRLCDDLSAATQGPELWARPRGPDQSDLRALVRSDRECDRRESDVVLRSLMQPDQPGAISTEFGRRLHLTVANRTGWFVGAEDDAKIGNGEVDRAHRRREDAVVEQAATGAEHHRERHQAEAIDEFGLQQGLEQFAVSPDRVIRDAAERDGSRQAERSTPCRGRAHGFR